MFSTSTKIFLLFSDIILYRLTLISPRNIDDVYLSQQLRSLMFERFSNIHLHLSEFINTIKFLFPVEKCIEKIIGTIDDIKSTIDNNDNYNDFSYFRTKLFYRGLKMENELDEIIIAFNKLDEELRKYGFIPVNFYCPRNLSQSDMAFLEFFDVYKIIEYLDEKINYFTAFEIEATKEIDSLTNKAN